MINQINEISNIYNDTKDRIYIYIYIYEYTKQISDYTRAIDFLRWWTTKVFFLISFTARGSDDIEYNR